jgi:hypothetical protein
VEEKKKREEEKKREIEIEKKKREKETRKRKEDNWTVDVVQMQKWMSLLIELDESGKVRYYMDRVPWANVILHSRPIYGRYLPTTTYIYGNNISYYCSFKLKINNRRSISHASSCSDKDHLQ